MHCEQCTVRCALYTADYLKQSDAMAWPQVFLLLQTTNRLKYTENDKLTLSKTFLLITIREADMQNGQELHKPIVALLRQKLGQSLNITAFTQALTWIILLPSFPSFVYLLTVQV